MTEHLPDMVSTPLMTFPSAYDAPPELMQYYFGENMRCESWYYDVDAAANVDSHMRRSHVAILTAAHLALNRTRGHSSRTAIILGVGRGRDIPLKEIATLFSHTTLVDVDPTAMEAAASELPEALSHKVSRIHADITGSAGAVLRQLQGAEDETDTFAAYATGANEVLAQADTSHATTEWADTYSFACSHLVADSLPAAAMHAVETVRKKYAAKIQTRLRLTSTASDIYAGNLRLAHSRLLGHLTVNGGAYYVAQYDESDPRNDTVYNPNYLRLAPPQRWRWKAGSRLVTNTVTARIYAGGSGR